MQNLALDTVDLLQLHVWNDEWLAEPDWFAPIEQLKRQGKIRYFGVSLNNHQPENVLKLIDTGLVDTVQVIFNIFDQSPKEKLFPVSLKKDIGIIVRVPFDEGSLTGKIDRHTTFPKDDFRNDYFRGDRRQQVEEHVRQLLECAQLEKSDLPAFALRFCLSWQAVSTVIPGMRKPQHVAANCAVADGNWLPSDLLKKLKSQAWQRNFYL